MTVPQDDRWGRTYEGYSEAPALTRFLGAAIPYGFGLGYRRPFHLPQLPEASGPPTGCPN